MTATTSFFFVWIGAGAKSSGAKQTRVTHTGAFLTPVSMSSKRARGQGEVDNRMASTLSRSVVRTVGREAEDGSAPRAPLVFLSIFHGERMKAYGLPACVDARTLPDALEDHVCDYLPFGMVFALYSLHKGAAATAERVWARKRHIRCRHEPRAVIPPHRVGVYWGLAARCARLATIAVSSESSHALATAELVRQHAPTLGRDEGLTASLQVLDAVPWRAARCIAEMRTIAHAPPVAPLWPRRRSRGRRSAARQLPAPA